MGKNLYVGNLNYSVTDTQLGELFSQYGDVISLSVLDNRGFGFVELDKDEDALRAIEELNDTEFEGRKLVVNEARPKTENTDRGGGRGRGKGRGNNRGGGGGRKY